MQFSHFSRLVVLTAADDQPQQPDTDEEETTPLRPALLNELPYY
jgi:hypothetical protein